TFLKENSYRLAVRNNDRNPLLNLLLQDVADESASHAIDIFEGFTTNLMVAVIRNYARAWRYIRATDTEKLLPAFQGLTEKQLEQIDGKISELSDRERVLFSHRFGEQRAINELRQYIMKERVLDEIYFRKFNSIKIDALQEKDKEQLMKEEFGIHKMFTILSSYIPVIAGEDEFSYMCRAFSLLKPFDTVNLYLIAKG
ncbi:hypothetical protein HY357_03960, partial [Candidatus Roizmanbacteria bacterium]|nr:hypothetical protein [Candidatus Roizmanbacteria bacterium]